MISGFGSERLGLLALRFPAIAALILAIFTVFTAFGLPKLGYSGDNIEILRDGSAEFDDYDHLLTTFRDFNNDAIVLITAPNLNTKEGFETYRDLHFELQFNERVESLLSPFSLASYDINAGGWQSTVPSRFTDDADVQAFLKRMNETQPSFQSLVTPTRDSAVIVIYTKKEALEDSNVRETLESYRETLAEFADEDFQLTLAGQPAIRADLVQSIVNDMRLLAPLAALLCALISFVLFRSPRAVLICLAPPVLSVLWLLGLLGHAGIYLNFLTSVLPILLMVIVFADTLHLYLKWARNHNAGMENSVALSDSLKTVGPACALAMITTAIALGSLLLSGNFGLIELGSIGAGAVVLGLIAVLVVLPLSLHYLAPKKQQKPAPTAQWLNAINRPAIALLPRAWIIAFAGAAICAAGIFAHFNLDSRFRLIDYLASSSSVSKSEAYIDERYSGTTPLFAVIKLDKSIPMLDEKNRDIFYRAKAAVDTVFPSTSSYSLDDFAEEVRKGGGEIRESDIDQLPEYMTSRFISKDRREVLITIFSPASITASQMETKLKSLDGLLGEQKLSDNVIITGFPILSSVVAPRLMDNLRISLLVAVLLSVVIIMIAARSVRLGLACLVPNLLPILAVEVALWALSIPLDMSITVALTVAFGIAVDDSIHLLNQYMAEQARAGGNDAETAVSGALDEVTPAMVSTSLILIAGLTITLMSELPIIILFSTIVILTLVFAVLTDIFAMPSYLVTLGRKK